ncbi:MAG: FtsX-like permease family protein, partial [Longimicrobiales bacterium]|nr:FtsX-like permease family protein [Longimicrobiales bacterium]
TVRSFRDRIVSDVESTLWIILGTVGFVLLIACANVANLFMVRAESRQKEMAVRAAMGAGRRSVVTSFLSESLLLGAAGGLVGVAFAVVSVPALLSLAELPRAAEVSVGPSSLALAAILSVATGLLFGAIPLTRYAGKRFGAILRDGSRGTTSGRERHRARSVLVATQLALGMVLLVGSGLMLRSFAQLRAVDLGIDGDDVLTVALNRNAGEDPEIAARFFQEVADRVARLPGVQEVGMATSIPLAGGNSNGGSFYIESIPREEGTLPPTGMYRGVGGEYFAAMDIPLVSGRPMERADWEEGRAVVWVNETFQRTHLGGDAIGERISWMGGEDGVAEEEWAEVVGVVGDVREFGMTEEDLRPNAYFPLRAGGGARFEIQSMHLAIEVAGGQDPASLAPAVHAEIRSLDAQVPITATRTMADVVAEEMGEVSATMIVLAIATAMALFLGAIGLAGVISYVVGQRTREIGVRVALGATAGDVGRLIMSQSVTVTVVGTLLGLAGA